MTKWHTHKAVSAALHIIQLGRAHAVTEGPKFHSRYHLTSERKLRSPNLKDEALEISEVRGPSERKAHNSYFGPLWKQGVYTLQVLLDPFESKVYTSQLQRGARGKCLACLPLDTPLYITLTMILHENTKPIEHVLLHPIWVLSHLMRTCKHCNVKLSLYYWTHWSCWWVYHFKKHRYHAIFHSNVDTHVD